MENNYGLIKAFGPSIFKAKIPDELLNKLNKFIDDTINNEEESKKLDVGKGLVGDVKQEFKLEYRGHSRIATIHHSLRTKKASWQALHPRILPERR